MKPSHSFLDGQGLVVSHSHEPENDGERTRDGRHECKTRPKTHASSNPPPPFPGTGKGARVAKVFPAKTTPCALMMCICRGVLEQRACLGDGFRPLGGGGCLASGTFTQRTQESRSSRTGLYARLGRAAGSSLLEQWALIEYHPDPGDAFRMLLSLRLEDVVPGSRSE